MVLDAIKGFAENTLGSLDSLPGADMLMGPFDNYLKAGMAFMEGNMDEFAEELAGSVFPGSEQLVALAKNAMNGNFDPKQILESVSPDVLKNVGQFMNVFQGSNDLASDLFKNVSPDVLNNIVPDLGLEDNVLSKLNFNDAIKNVVGGNVLENIF